LALLRNIQDNARHPIHGSTMLGAIMVWPLIGGAVGYWSAGLLGLPATASTVAIIAGMLVGFCVGFYAALGTTNLARVLSLPGIVFFWT
jgi:hypothetical protein